MVVQVPVPLEYELPLLLTEQENACLDKKNPCGGNNQGPNDLSSYKSGKKKPRFPTQKSHHQPRSNPNPIFSTLDSKPQSTRVSKQFSSYHHKLFLSSPRDQT
ncbi:hypothetical protein Peur_013509 [Populus x canadensis]